MTDNLFFLRREQEVVEEARAERMSREGLSPGRRAKKVLSPVLRVSDCVSLVTLNLENLKPKA